MSVLLVLGFLFNTNTSVVIAEKNAQFGVPRESYGVVTETNMQESEVRKTFISSVQSVLRNQPERVVSEDEKIRVPEPIIAEPIPEPLAVATPSTSTPEVQPASTTTPKMQDEIIQSAQ